MTVTFRCGHKVTVPAAVEAPPVCACGERIVSNVTGATPRFRGACRGPHAEFAQLDPDRTQFSPSTLKLKSSNL
jgi:hypothetical protein